MQHALNGGEALRQLIGGAGLHDTGDLLQLGVGLLHQGVVLQGDNIAMAKILRLHAAEGTVTVMVGNEILQSLLTGDEFGIENIAQGVDFRADASGFGIGQAAVHIHQDLTGLVQVLHHNIQIIGQDGEAAHNQKASHRDAHSGEGHEAMEENSPEAFL